MGIKGRIREEGRLHIQEQLQTNETLTHSLTFEAAAPPPPPPPPLEEWLVIFNHIVWHETNALPCPALLWACELYKSYRVMGGGISCSNVCIGGKTKDVSASGLNDMR